MWWAAKAAGLQRHAWHFVQVEKAQLFENAFPQEHVLGGIVIRKPEAENPFSYSLTAGL